mmetsp:Transcript_48/g.197  ORF Transcript_48/g.197 Transcript_48/m.197 type:complete len:201 (-) Transcript_48:753-1355(-)
MAATCKGSPSIAAAPLGAYEPTSSRSKFERAILDSRETFTLSRKLCVKTGMKESRTSTAPDALAFPSIRSLAAKSSLFSLAASASNEGCSGSLSVAKSPRSSKYCPPRSVQNSWLMTWSHVKRACGRLMSNPETKFLNVVPYAAGNGAGSCSKICSINDVNDVLVNGGRPVAHSYSTHPNAHKSVAYECTPSCVNISGAI